MKNLNAGTVLTRVNPLSYVLARDFSKKAILLDRTGSGLVCSRKPSSMTTTPTRIQATSSMNLRYPSHQHNFINAKIVEKSDVEAAKVLVTLIKDRSSGLLNESTLKEKNKNKNKKIKTFKIPHHLMRPGENEKTQVSLQTIVRRKLVKVPSKFLLKGEPKGVKITLGALSQRKQKMRKSAILLKSRPLK